MPKTRPLPRLRDLSRQRARQETATFLEDVVAGLRRPRKELPCKYFYDERGSELFEEICALPEYYLFRTELRILEDRIDSITRLLGKECLLIEPGSGSSRKTRLLLDHLEDPVGYVPVDLSGEFLISVARELAAAYPLLEVLPVCADFTKPFLLPAPREPAGTATVFFPGSTLGNFHPPDAVALLRRLSRLGHSLLIGIDLKKDPEDLERAYNDAEGVTARFNLNLLERINRELDGDFDLRRFKHRARYNAERERVEMDLVSLGRQVVHVGAEEFFLEPGETLRTEHCYKYGIDDFVRLVAEAGLEPRQGWTDGELRFAVFLCERC